MKKKIFSVLKYLLFLGFGIFLVWWSLHKIPANRWKDFWAAFTSAKYWLLVPVFFILFSSHLLRSWRWRMLMKPMGYRPHFKNVFFAVMIGYLANLAIPRLGEVLKCTILAKYEHVPADKLVGTIVAERAFDLLCLLLVFALAFALQFDEIGHLGISLFEKLSRKSNGELNLQNLGVIAVAFIGTIVLLKLLLKKFKYLVFVRAIRKVIGGIWKGITSAKEIKQKWHFAFATAGIWILYLVGTWVGFKATAATAHLPFEVAVSVLAFASLGMILTPGGIGAYALFLARVLQRNDIPFEIAYANGTLQWFAQFLIIILVGFISLGLLPYINKKPKALKKVPDNEEARNHHQ